MYLDGNLHILDLADMPYMPDPPYKVGEMDEKMRSKYGLIDRLHRRVHDNVGLVCERLALIGGSRVLDLGCGSGYPCEDGVIYPPWVCRILYEIGMTPVGIDVRQLDEEFECHRIDLTDPEMLDIFPDASFDLATEHYLFDSMPHRDDMPRIKGELMRQMRRVVRLGGYFITNTFYSDPAPELEQEEQALQEVDI